MKKEKDKIPQLTNHQILNIYLSNNLIKECVDNQFYKYNKKYKEDFFNDLILIILEYNNEKLNDAHYNNHFNAFLTRIIQNNINSTTSPYYKTYMKYEDNKEELTNKYNELEDNK